MCLLRRVEKLSNNKMQSGDRETMCVRARTHARNPCMRAPSAKLALTYHHGDGDLLHVVLLLSSASLRTQYSLQEEQKLGS